jgi:hypothetical protein
MDALSQSEAAAERIRGELERTVAELDRRRKRVLDIRAQVQAHLWLAGLLGSGVLALAGGAVALGIWRHRTGPRRLRAQRMRSLKRAWKHPDLLFATGGHPAGELGRKVLAASLSAAAVQLGRLLAVRLFASRT